ncbi:helix-turn-helix domain-containing protein [Aestuariibacter halophilus]|uniref:Helix-turn-helix domain-containing protein n=1 Tax=Fluctibacter halophilus TaxID=226011 RepID=A0ABS8G3Q7_9ALTE|nr:helix-turn-helix domain-containing protein [Aestuariibacter halophilus]MCC2614736.1 helix-turn-helix domain-containing protein [Aestuariibacter halophilus]
MDNLQQYIHATSVFNSFALGGLLLAQSNPGYAGRILALWCFCLSLFSVTPLLLISDTLPGIQRLAVITLWLPATFGPLLYLYLNSLTQRRAYRWRDSLHFLPLLMCVLLTYANTMESLADINVLRQQGIAKTLSHQLAQGIIYTQAVVYALLCGRVIYQYRRLAEYRLSNYDPSVFQHLLFVWGLNLLVWLCEILSSALGGVYALALGADVLLLCLIAGLALMHWKSPYYLRLRNLPVTETESAETVMEGSKPPSQCPDLSTELSEVMEQQQAYLDPELTLDTLASRVGVSRHLLSEYINTRCDKNFHRFVNEYRIEHLCQQLSAAPANAKILDLALSSGFSSKSTFNHVFKQYTGLTPSQYRQSLVTV